MLVFKEHNVALAFNKGTLRKGSPESIECVLFRDVKDAMLKKR